jgi:hypothetical protein
MADKAYAPCHGRRGMIVMLENGKSLYSESKRLYNDREIQNIHKIVNVTDI